METQRTKALYIITKSNWGGAQRYVYDLATSLPKDRYEAVVAFGGNGVLGERLAAAGIRTVSISSLERDIGMKRDIQSLFALATLIRREKPDIVHVNSSKVGGLGAFAARALRVRRIVFTSHGWPWNEERRLSSKALIRVASWLTVALAHVTIAVSERDRREGSYLPFVGCKVRLVRNGMRSPDFMSRDDASQTLRGMAKSAGLNGDKFLVGAIGELHKNKGYPYLLQALAQTVDTELVVIGGGEDREALEQLRDELGLRKRAAFIGFVPDASRLLRGFDAFALSSVKEGMPYVVIEAGFAGLPVVATDVGGVKEIIDDMRSGILVQPRRPGDMAKAIDLLRTDLERARSFGDALRTGTEEKFSLERMVRETTEIYAA